MVAVIVSALSDTNHDLAMRWNLIEVFSHCMAEVASDPVADD